MFEIQNAAVFLNFVKTEKNVRNFFYLFLGLIYLLSLLAVGGRMLNCDQTSCSYNWLESFSFHSINILETISEISHFIVFSILFLILVLLKKHHVYEYEVRMKGILIFGCFLGVYYCIDIILTMLDAILSKT